VLIQRGAFGDSIALLTLVLDLFSNTPSRAV
jgi:hypothetical protein